MMSLFKKICKEIAFRYSYEGKEIRRISNLVRFKNGTVKIFPFEFGYVDSASFASQYMEIFKRKIYNFNSKSDKPYIIDCGANIGVSILFFKMLYPNSEITAFEPDKKIFAVLKDNIVNSNYQNISLINKGLWNREGKMNFIDEGSDGGSVLRTTRQDINNNIVDIEVTSLKDYLNRNVDFLKIDIEGAEYIVMEDCQYLLEKVKRIFIEFHSHLNEEQKLDLILQVLSKSGFRYYIESAGLKNKSPFISRETINNYDNLLTIYAYRESSTDSF